MCSNVVLPYGFVPLTRDTVSRLLGLVKRSEMSEMSEMSGLATIIFLKLLM